MNTAPDESDSGVLLIGHGTRDPSGTEQFFELSGRLAEAMRGVPVVASLLEFQHPTIPEGWTSLVERGVRHIHVAPLLLFAAGHAKQDIPDEIAQCRRQTPEVTFDQSRPLSRHPALVDLVVQRIDASLNELSVDPQRVAVVMVGRGNRDPCAQADMKVLTEVTRRRIGCGGAFTAFYAMASPPVPESLDSIAGSGDFDQIVVYPHLLFQGRLLDAIHRQVDEAAERHPHLRFATAEHLGPHQQVAKAIQQRIAQASVVTADAECR